MNTEKIEKLKKSLSNSKIPADLKPKIEAEIKRLENLDAKQSEPKEEVKPVAKKTTTRKPRATKSVAKKTSTRKPSETSKPKSTPMSLAKEIRKEGESWSDARARASKMMKEKTHTATKDVESELDKLTKLVRGKKELRGQIGQTNLLRDAKRKAKPMGRRVSKDGNVYYENRANRTDRGTFGKYHLAKGGEIEFQHSNLIIVGAGMDSNGNRVVKVSFPNERPFSIQTNGNLPKTHSLLKAYDKNTNFSAKEIESMEDEIVDYVENYGSENQKKSLKVSGSWLDKDNYAKGGSVDNSIIDELWRGYASAILFTETDMDSGEPLDSEFSIYDFNKESEANSKKMLSQYYSKYKDAIEESELDLETVGMDIWYTQSGQGAGFFDHSLDQEVEDKLTKGAEEFGKFPSTETYRGKVIIRGGKSYADGGGVGSDRYDGKTEEIVLELKNLKGGLYDKAPRVYQRDGLIYVSAENGDNYADYDEYLFIDEQLEELADKYDTYWDWENAGAIVLMPLSDEDEDEYADGGEISSKQLDLGYQYSFNKDEDNVGSLYKEAGVYSVIGFENGKHFSESFEKFSDAKKFYLDKKGKVKFELGGTVVTDLAGHTGGSLGGDPSLLSGTSGTAYTGLVGETGAMSSGEMFEAGGTLPSGASQSYMVTEAFGNPAQHYANGGGLPAGAEQSYINYYLGEGSAQGIYAHGGGINEKTNKMRKQKLKKGDDVLIIGRRWFDRVNGNTYHTAEVQVNGEFVGKSRMTYGYDEQYLETGKEILLDHYELPRGMKENAPLWQLREYGVVLHKYAIDGLKRELAKGGGFAEHNGRKYDIGRNWTKDHNEFDKGADHEVEYRRKKSFFADGGEFMTDPTFGNFQNQVFAKGGKVSPFKNMMETNTITEKEINLIKLRLNNDKVDEDTQEAIDYIWEEMPKLTPDQNKKGIDYLRNLWKSPTGKERANNPFGYREQDVLETFEYFALRGFYDAGNRYRKFYVPLYAVFGEDSSFEYAFYNGEVNILG